LLTILCSSSAGTPALRDPCCALPILQPPRLVTPGVRDFGPPSSNRSTHTLSSVGRRPFAILHQHSTPGNGPVPCGLDSSLDRPPWPSRCICAFVITGKAESEGQTRNSSHHADRPAVWRRGTVDARSLQAGELLRIHGSYLTLCSRVDACRDVFPLQTL
jgi:hypothetical protein